MEWTTGSVIVTGGVMSKPALGISVPGTMHLEGAQSQQADLLQQQQSLWYILLLVLIVPEVPNPDVREVIDGRKGVALTMW